MLIGGGAGAHEIEIPMKHVLLVGMLVFCVTMAHAQRHHRPKRTDLRGRLSSVQQKKNQIRREIKRKQREAHIVMADIERVDGKLSQLEGDLEDTGKKLVESKSTQRTLKSSLEMATKRLEMKREQLRKRLRAMYMHGEGSIVTALVGSQSVSDFATRKAVLERVARKDRDLYNEVRNLQTTISQQKTRQDHLVVEVSSLEQRQKTEQSSLKDTRQEKKAYLGELESQQQELRRQYDELEQESRSLAAQIRAYQASRRGTKQEVSPYHGSLRPPVSGRITSGFGMRFHPILHERRMHTGLDFGAPLGAAIHAAGPGVVMTAGYMRGYGYTVTIDHGGGVSTLYGHCSRLMVGRGDRVSQGQHIANVGSTGLSTGPHCHFEVRINGSPVDPRSRL